LASAPSLQGMNGSCGETSCARPSDMAAPRCAGLMRPWRRYSSVVVVRLRSYIAPVSRLHCVVNHMFEHRFEPSPLWGWIFCRGCCRRKIVSLGESLTLGRLFRQASPCALNLKSCRVGNGSLSERSTVYMPSPGRGLGAAPLAPADCTLLNAAHLRFAPSAAKLSLRNGLVIIFSIRKILLANLNIV
jgi:hypothetical protein